MRCARLTVQWIFSASWSIYAPQATVKLRGNSVIYASVVANSIILNGNASVHYDEALQDVGLSQGYTVVSWDEL